MTRTRSRGLALALPILLGLTTLSACGDDPGDSPSPSASASESASPAEPSESTSASSSASTEPLPDGPLATRFIAPEDLPGLNDEWEWDDVSTGHSEPEGFGQCAEFDALSIGATEALTRQYAEAGTADPSATAAMQLLQFPDARTAQRATRVLESWHDSCTERIRPRLSPEVSPIQEVEVSTDRGSWYLVTTTRPASDEGHFHAFGMVVSGARMALLTMDNDGQDRNYEPGQDPMELAVAVAADRIR